ncbi:PAS domain-containing protein [Azohydromonas caseinilytica]|uniref:histidine kinase n=1 Tax=Azohydromonas caseinilytica TaxID=2728836 RepID=A0A848F9C7_9BURK|nr:PAS domain-containing protein [Azohydromonas caseinilytica]NML15436.1 PAS domain-containing protein [Azohydromonas caseinilytica]
MNAHTPSRHFWVLGLLLVLAATLGGLALQPGPAALAPALGCALLLAALLLRRARRHEQMLQMRLVEQAQRVGALQQALEVAQAQRGEAMAAVRAGEQRYELALRGSQDGLWEWDIAADRMRLSPRWKSMLGFAEHELGEARAQWRERIHPQDLPALEQALQRHLADAQARFQCELRLLHKDGSLRWVLSRGVALRHASGTPYRMVGLDTDVTPLKRVETILDAVARGTADAFGEAFFKALVRHFARALEVDCAFITECADQPPTRVRTLAFWAGQRWQDNIEYGLPGTPCEQVVGGGRTCFLRSDVQRLYPVESGYEAYLGLPIVAQDGRVLGHLAFLDREPRGEELLLESVYRIFTARAAIELELREARQRLRAIEAAGS